MRLIVTGDWHLDAMTAGQSRLPEQHAVLEQLIARVDQHCSECLKEQRGERVLVLFLGDLCNPERGSRTLNAITEGAWAFRQLRECGAYVVAINGNHDVTDSANGLSTLSPLKEALPEVVVCNTPTSMVFGDIDRGIRFLLLPYMAPSWGVRWCETLKMTVPQWVEQQFKQYGNGCVVAGHLSIEGALLGSETLDMPRGRENAFPVTESNGALLRLNGHYHKRQSPHGIWCPGSPVRLAFGEENNPTGWLEWRL